MMAKYDVIVFPCCQTNLGQEKPTTGNPVPYRKSAETPNLGFPDSAADIRYGMGMEGLKNLHDFVQQGGTLITEGSTAALCQFSFTKRRFSFRPTTSRRRVSKSSS